MSSKNYDGGEGGRGASQPMSEERPLDSMLPELRAPSRRSSEPIEARPIHLRLLEVRLEESREWALACWEDPGAESLARDLNRFIRAVLLRELTRPFSQVQPDREFSALRLFVFTPLSPASVAALKSLHLKPALFVPDEYQERMAALRGEGAAAKVAVGERPELVFSLDISRHEPAIDHKLAQAQCQMLAKIGEEKWGETPGGPSRLMAIILKKHFGARITPSRDGLHALELFLTQQAPGALRWMQPALFLALCDFIGVILHSVYHLNVQWALCEPNPQGVTPPPALGVRQKSGFKTLPIASLLVDWCVMPRAEDSPALADRVEQLAREYI